jgi:hypothetical protein
MSNLASMVSVPEQVLFRDLAGEGVLLELTSGRYFGLNETGTRMWWSLIQHRHVAAALEALLQEYDVPQERLEKELLELVDSLASQKLLNVLEA